MLPQLASHKLVHPPINALLSTARICKQTHTVSLLVLFSQPVLAAASADCVCARGQHCIPTLYVHLISFLQ